MPSKSKSNPERLAVERTPSPHRPMQREPEIAAELRRLLPELRGQLLDAAERLLENPADVALLSMRSMATAIGVPPVTMVRLAKRLGLPGYNAVRQPYIEMMKSERAWNVKPARMAATHARTHGTSEFVADYFKLEQIRLDHAAAALSRPSLEAAVKSLARGRRIFVVARRTTYPIAWSLAYSLRKVRAGITLLGSGNEGLEADLVDCGNDDVLIAISLPPYSRVTKAATDKAAKVGATIIAITDKISAPVAQVAHHVFVTNVDAESFPESTLAPTAIGNLMVALLVTELGNVALDRISATDNDIAEGGEFVSNLVGNSRRGKRRA